MAKNILITGAAGFVGSRLAYKLLKEGHSLFLLDDFSYGKEDNLIFDDYDFNKEIFRIDIRDEEKLKAFFGKNHFDYIYHLAGITPLPDNQANPGYAFSVNVAGAANIFEMARVRGTERVFFSSTSAVYENMKDFPSREDMDIVPPSLVYPMTKFAAEKIAHSFYEVYKLPITVFRFSNIYGPAMDVFRKMPPVAGAFIKKYFYGEAPIIYDGGEQKRDFIYVEDLLKLCELAMRKNGFDILNIGTGEWHSVNEMCEIIRLCMGKETEPVYANADSYWDNFPELYGGKFPIDKKFLLKEAVKPTLLSIEHAHSEYGYKPDFTFEEGLKRTVEWTVEKLRNISSAVI